jgi:predicted small metal-binding protein
VKRSEPKAEQTGGVADHQLRTPVGGDSWILVPRVSYIRHMTVKFECYQTGCDFMIRADTEDELVHLVQEHAERTHDLSIDRGAIVAETEQV